MNKKYIMMIIDPDKKYSSELADHAKKSGFFFEASYALNGEDGYRSVFLLKPDIIILEALIPVLDGICLLKKINSEYIEKKPIIIMNTYTRIPGMITAATRYGVDYFMIKPQSYENICTIAHELLNGMTTAAQPQKEKNINVENEISCFLKSLGIPAHLDGYKYIRSALLYTINDPSIISPITKKLYPALAEKYNTTKNCIERAMRHAIEVSWQRGNKKLLSDIFGYCRDNIISRPTNAEYIAMTADDMRIRLKR